MRRAMLPSVIACTALAVSVAGCGVSDEGIRPGVAAEVDGQTLELGKLDRAVQDYCDLLASNDASTAVPTAAVRADLTRLWTQAVAVEEIADTYRVDLPSDVVERDFVERAWSSLGEIDDDNYESFEWLTWVQLRVNDPLLEIGNQIVLDESGQMADQDTAAARGFEAVSAWLEEAGVEFNPVFGHLDPETDQFEGDALSIAVSAGARDGVQKPPFSAEQVAALPATQRCGPAVPAEAQVQPGA